MPFALTTNLIYSSFSMRNFVQTSGAMLLTDYLELFKAVNFPPSIKILMMHSVFFFATAKYKGVLPYKSFADGFALYLVVRIFTSSAQPALAAQCRGVIFKSSISKAKQGFQSSNRRASLSAFLIKAKNYWLLQKLQGFFISPLFAIISSKLKFYSFIVLANLLTTFLNLAPRSVDWWFVTLYFFINYFDLWVLDSRKQLSFKTQSAAIPFFCFGIRQETLGTISYVQGISYNFGGGEGGPGKYTLRFLGSYLKYKGYDSEAIFYQFLRKSSNVECFY